jgi:hypothetical protein
MKFARYQSFTSPPVAGQTARRRGDSIADIRIHADVTQL